jgi:hypothetical protein
MDNTRLSGCPAFCILHSQLSITLPDPLRLCVEMPDCPAFCILHSAFCILHSLRLSYHGHDEFQRHMRAILDVYAA